jgi:hypothetical protein
LSTFCANPSESINTSSERARFVMTSFMILVLEYFY